MQKGFRMATESFFFRALKIDSNLLKEKKETKNKENCIFGISVPKKILKKSTKRNKCKRQLRSMLTEQIKNNNNSCNFIDQHKHLALIIIVRDNYLKQPYLKNKEQLYKTLRFIYKRIL